MMNVLKEILTGEAPEEKKEESKQETTKQEYKKEEKDKKERFEEKDKKERFEEKDKKYEGQVLKSTAPVTELKTEKPEIVKETVVQKQKEVVQPEINRQREQVEIKQVTQPYLQTEVKPTIVSERQLPTEYREYKEGMSEQTKKDYKEESEKFKSTTQRAPVEYQKVEKAPIIHETVHKVVKTEEQPVIYKETIQPKVIKEVKPIHEKIIEAPVVHKETREVKKLEPIVNAGQEKELEGQGLEKKFEKISVSEKEKFSQQSSQQQTFKQS